MLQHIRSFLFLALCFGIGIGIAKAVQWWRRPSAATVSPATTGFGRLVPFRGFALEPRTDLSPGSLNEALAALHATHASALAIHYPATADPQDLARFVQQLHASSAARGLPLILLPPKIPASGIRNPFPRPLPDIAAQAQRLGFDILIVSWLSSDPDQAYWRSQLALVRQAFRGKIILAASYEVVPGIEFWDAGDYIGAFSNNWDLTGKDQPTAHDLRVGWSAYLDTLESLSRRHGKPLFLLDAAFAPILPIIHPKPRTAARTSAQTALEYQLDNYQALLLETKGRQNTDGLVFADWNLSPRAADDPLAPNSRPAILQAFTDTWNSEGTAPPADTQSTEPAPSDDDP